VGTAGVVRVGLTVVEVVTAALVVVVEAAVVVVAAAVVVVLAAVLALVSALTEPTRSRLLRNSIEMLEREDIMLAARVRDADAMDEQEADAERAMQTRLKTTGLDGTEQDENGEKREELSQPLLKRWNAQILSPRPWLLVAAS